MREHRIICKKCGVVLTLQNFPDFSPKPRCGVIRGNGLRCGGLFYGVVDGRGGLTNDGLAWVMAEVESKDVAVRHILVDQATWRKLDSGFKDEGEYWGKAVVMDGCIFVVDEKPA